MINQQNLLLSGALSFSSWHLGCWIGCSGACTAARVCWTWCFHVAERHQSFLLALLSCSFFPKGISGYHITVEGEMCLEMHLLFHPCHSYHSSYLAGGHGK